ncbi:homoserine dehydrogenase [Dethiobacter alkaliphilus]|uniref:Homoserine dehydrogenase n=1 Tax=Dethiobacter alkaliphilus AHT 1 TaxID=555088 RepID=C0GCS1_DETAL|nr:homoserine dehydrogenase [Dethiobacter alkaliphilus]EEG79006.1 Homoserine dehydrogenase [Dethiobacter alkaliphilus AHT 1]
MTKKDVLQIGMIGLGTVGTGVLRILEKNGEEIRHKLGVGLEVKRIAVRDPHKPREIEVDPSLIVDHPDHVVNDPDIDIVVEVMGGVDLARQAIARALENGKFVVTANKDLMAQHGLELLAIAKNQNRNIFYEASVAGGIPLIRPLKNSLAANHIEKVMGIVNGTTNYILTQMSCEGKEFSEALAEAQEKGFAEADPASDIEGLDASYKLAIIAALSFSSKIDMKDIFVEGITNVKLRDIRYAQELGYAIKLLAIGEETEEGLQLRVHPTLIPADHPLAAVANEFNAIFLEGDAVGEVMFYGPGAGSLPTGSAVCADIMDAARCLQHEVENGIVEATFGTKKVVPMEKQQSRFYLRLKAKDEPGVFASLATAFGETKVSLDMIIQKRSDAETAEIVLVTHGVSEGNFQKALDTIEAMPAIRSINAILRVIE